MQNTHIDIRFEGKRFSPKKLKDLTGLPIEIVAEYGEISNKGRYKGKSSPYGLALLKIDGNDHNLGLNIALLQYSSLLIEKKKALVDSGVEEIIVDVETPLNTESRFSFEAELLKKLNVLNARIDFHTIEDEENLETILWEVNLQVQLMIKNKIIAENQFRKFDHLLRRELLTYNAVHEPNPNIVFFKYTTFSILLYILKYKNEKDEDIPSFKEVYKNFSSYEIE